MNVYDFDNTILRGDSSARFFAWCLVHRPRMWRDVPGQAVNGLMFLLKLRPKQAFKQRMFHYLTLIGDVDGAVEAFWADNFSRVKAWYPPRHREDDVQEYAAQEIRNAIAFVEKHTGMAWDWKAYFECAKRVNYATKCRQEWLEMNRTEYPQVFGSNLALYTETNYMAICGRIPAFEKADRKISKLAKQAYEKKKMAAKEYRHRAIIWGVQSHYYMDFLVWLLNCWGIVPLTDMLSCINTEMIADTDTPENREQAYYDMAMLTEEMIMRNRTHGGYKVLLDDLFEFVEQYNADMIILWEHITCKALDGMHGLFEDRARDLGIPLIWVDHQLFDPRVISRQGVRDQVNSYMRTVMQEEPLDPSLEVLDDENAW